MKERRIIGCIADDFTGASDAASFLKAGGLDTILCSGIPEEGFVLPGNCEAVVIALKSRTQETRQAVADSLAAIMWLEKQGFAQFYVKYCSTFDSTPKGNIGPVMDAVADYLEVSGSILCPALPANGRIVREGILFVNGVPLAESPMKDHPLTPMWESRIAALMAPQSKYPTLELNGEALYGSEGEVQEKVQAFLRGNKRGYIIPDYCNELDAERIVALFGQWKLLSGGSGILKALASRHRVGDTHRHMPVKENSRALILAGSCSVATGKQTDYFLASGGYGIRLEDDLVMEGKQNPELLWQQAALVNGTALIYAYETPEGLQAKRNEAGRKLAKQIEDTLAETAALAVRNGRKRIIVAGGETSGAVTRKLGYRSFYIGDSIAPGVPILIPLEDTQVRLVLKSGNFGQEDFFVRALQMTEE